MSNRVNKKPVIRVRRCPGQPSLGRLSGAGVVLPCALGKGGIRTLKREGDGATPRGRFPLRRVWLRGSEHHGALPRLPVRRTTPADGWCDDVGHDRYNRPVRLPFGASHEKMWRDDNLYDIVIEIGWNDRPAIRNRGSAIFMHLARTGYTPTEGCVALSRRDMLRLLPRLTRHTRIDIA
jgi:L,D-peptidoglycan transpeptidase YkuD (ErfK/YbiS/YcfS/YnhG family)